MERESSTSVASDLQTENMMAFLFCNRLFHIRPKKGVREKMTRKNKRKRTREREERRTISKFEGNSWGETSTVFVQD